MSLADDMMDLGKQLISLAKRIETDSDVIEEVRLKTAPDVKKGIKDIFNELEQPTSMLKVQEMLVEENFAKDVDDAFVLLQFYIRKGEIYTSKKGTIQKV